MNLEAKLTEIAKTAGAEEYEDLYGAGAGALLGGLGGYATQSEFEPHTDFNRILIHALGGAGAGALAQHKGDAILEAIRGAGAEVGEEINPSEGLLERIYRNPVAGGVGIGVGAAGIGAGTTLAARKLLAARNGADAADTALVARKLLTSLGK